MLTSWYKGQFPKWQQGQASWILICSLASFGKKPGMKQQNFQDSHRLGQLLFRWDWKALLTFYFLFSVLINCLLGHQELDKAERSWLISSWAEEERWRQSFLSKAPVVLSPEELKKHLGTFSLTSDSSLSCSKMFKKTYTPWRCSKEKAFFKKKKKELKFMNTLIKACPHLNVSLQPKTKNLQVHHQPEKL